jgi:DNA repair exonuclease SbcCD ATPase subunit
MSTPLRFKELQVRNFMSFGNQTTSIDLNNYGSTLIQGENVDASSNNGAGKTTIINALCYAFYNKPFDNISLQRLINSTNATKNTQMEVRVIFEKGDDEYEIFRQRGESFNIQVFQNGDDITLDSVAENDKMVEEIIGISYDLFTKIIIFSGNSTPFLMMPQKQQRDLIEELFNITMLTEKATKLREQIKRTEGDISIQEAVIKEQEAQAALFQKQLKDAELRVSRWDTDRKATISQIRTQLETYRTVNIDEERELHSIADDVSRQLATVQSSISILKKDRTTLASDVRKLEDELKHLLDDKCPYCLQQYAGAGDKLQEKQKTLEAKKNKLTEVDDKLLREQTIATELSDQIELAKSAMRYPSLSAAIKAETEAKTAEQKITELQESTNPHIEAHEQLKSQSIKEISYSTLDGLKKDLDHQAFLLKLLTDKNSFIRRSIISKTIPFLNARLVNYTKDLGLPHIVKFDDDMSCTVSEYGRELDFGNLSSGEKKRVNLSLSLAFRDVLHHLHSRANCLFIDEIDASLDGSGVENVFRLLKQKSRDDSLALWIISHRPEAIGRFDRTLIVRKQNGFSQIIEDGQLEAA